MDVFLPADVSAYALGGWSLSLWAGRFGDEEANAPRFHLAISELEELLKQAGSVDLEMPDFDAWAYGVEGRLAWRGHRYGVVVNTFDGVVAIEHFEREPLEAILTVINSKTRLVA